MELASYQHFDEKKYNNVLQSKTESFKAKCKQIVKENQSSFARQLLDKTFCKMTHLIESHLQFSVYS